MRRLLGFCLLASFATCVSALEVDGNITVEVKKIRNKKGHILVMAQINENSEPIYSFAKITGHTVEVTLKGTGAKEYVISVFHDENGNWKLDTDERGIPIEGFARKNYQTDSHEPCCLKLYYPKDEEL